MHRLAVRSLALFVALAVAVGGPALAPTAAQEGTPVPVRYAFTEIGGLGGGFSIALEINDAGQVVGFSALPPDPAATPTAGPGGGRPPTHAFLWEAGAVTDLGTLGGASSAAAGINDAGHVAGGGDLPDGSEHAALWKDGTVTDLGTLGGFDSQAIAINNANQVAGLSTTAPGQQLGDPGTHAFVWADGQMTDLGTLGGEFSRANGINDRGQAVGAAETAEGAIHAFLWEGGTMTDLGTVPGWDGSRAIWVNEAGQVVGFLTDPTGAAGTPTAGLAPEATRPFLWQDGVMTPLETPDGASAIAIEIGDDGRTIVGSVEVAPGTAAAPPVMHAMIWVDGVPTDLNTLVPAGTTVLANIGGINRAGQICGQTADGRAFLLTPVG